MNVGSLFSGIGGFDLGLERAGMRTVWFCEQDEFCQRVIAKHWPRVPCYPDVRELRGADLEPVDVLCGGFPCQDISVAGRGAGIAGERSGLWSEYARLVGELRPRYVLVENVSALLARGLGRVLGDLAESGYDAEWDCLPAAAFGAPHLRDRLWLVAYPSGARRRQITGGALGDEGEDAWWAAWHDHEPGGTRQGLGALPDPPQQWRMPIRRFQLPEGSEGARHLFHRAPEPSLSRVDARIPRRMDRTSALGNALVPQIAEWIGRRIMTYEENHG